MLNPKYYALARLFRPDFIIQKRCFSTHGSSDYQARQPDGKKRIQKRRSVNVQNVSETINSPRSSVSYPPKVFPVIAMCTAEAYDFARLIPHLQRRFNLSPLACNDVLHMHDGNGDSSAFIFQNGSFVAWNPTSEKAIADLREELRPFEEKPISSVEKEQMTFRPSINASEPPGMQGEVIITGSTPEQSTRSMLAFSNGLADSAKLSVLETVLGDFLEHVRPIPVILESGGKLPVTRAEVLKLTGNLLHFRALLNLNSELADSPDLYWSEPELEALYTRISRNLETRQRISALNKKLDYANESVQVLRSHLSEQHGLKLEWGIIALIAVEVCFEVVHWLS